jgi:hypothetical protein
MHTWKAPGLFRGIKSEDCLGSNSGPIFTSFATWHKWFSLPVPWFNFLKDWLWILIVTASLYSIYYIWFFLCAIYCSKMSHILTYLILTTSPWSRKYYYFHLQILKMRCWEVKVICQRSYRYYGVGSVFESTGFDWGTYVTPASSSQGNKWDHSSSALRMVSSTW